jgi:RNA polymerase sigma-70 factor (ECF subfamily)
LRTLNDAELVRATIAGDKNAYGTLYDRYAPLVRAVCYDCTRNVPDAQDLGQDVFLRAYTRLGQLRKPESFGPWIVSIARLRCSEWRRENARHRGARAESNGTEPVGSEPSDGHLEEVRRMITRLPEKERLVLHVFYTQGKSADDARRIVGLSRSGFYRALDQARKRLREFLSREPENVR